MGIILENSKQIFDELVGTNLFDEIFKNSLRDYYTYGFKSFSQFLKGQQTINERWKIFTKVLGEKWYLEKGKNGRNYITLKTMPRGADNPIDEMYFFHNLRFVGDCLNYLFDLDPETYLNLGEEALPVKEDELKEVEGEQGRKYLEESNSVENAIVDNWLNSIRMGKDIERDEYPVRINRQLNIWTLSTRGAVGSYKDKYKNLSNRTRDMEALGLLGNLKNNTSVRNEWLNKEWKKWDQKFKRYFRRETSGNDYWIKQKLTMAKLVDFGARISGIETKLFVEKLRELCNFFSQYMPLGEVGTILGQRCAKMTSGNDFSYFRFKHNYIQKSLYDYNLIDLWIAIENRYMCWIQYTHGINLSFQEVIIIPLQVRISVINGREYVLYYHILDKKIKALRLEFIEKIIVYSHVKDIKYVMRTVSKDGKKSYRKTEDIKKILIDTHELAMQVDTAMKMLTYLWGTEVEDCDVNDEWEKRLKTYVIDIAYNSKENFIHSRMKKETRKFADINNSEIDRLEIRCFSTKELRNWVRGFYMRLKDVGNLETSEFSISNDVNKIWSIYNKDVNLPGGEVDEIKKKEKQEISKFGYDVVGDIVADAEGHGSIFNEFFSKYTVVLMNALLKCCNNADKRIKDCLLEEISQVFDYYNEEEIARVADELEMYAKNAELIDKNNNVRFTNNKTDYLYEFLPLTKIEVRWLLTVLDIPLARIFFAGHDGFQMSKASSIIEDIKKYLTSEVELFFEAESFKMDVVKYYDMYNQEFVNESREQDEEIKENNIRYLGLIYNAIRSGKKVKIVYKNWEGKEMNTLCSPAWIEYSRRDNIFRIWHSNKSKTEVFLINVPRIVNVEVLHEDTYNIKEEQGIINKILDKKMRQLKIEFYQGEKNLPDRILTEFSLWKKECVYDTKTKKFTMTIYYVTIDEKEIMIRLMSYGPYIKIVEDEGGYISKELNWRIAKQRDIIQTKELER